MSAHRRILVVRTDRLGDVILTLPMLPLLRRWFPGAYLAMLLNRYTGAIVQGNPHLDELLWYDREGEQVPFTDMLRSIRLRAFDTVIVVHPTPRLAWLFYRAGIPNRVGTGYRYYSFLFNRRVYDHRKDARFHELEYNLRLLRAVNPEFNGEEALPQFDLRIDPASQAHVRQMLPRSAASGKTRLVVLHPGSGGSARDWPATHFEQLASRLSAIEGIQVCVTGGPGESRLVEGVASAAGADVPTFAGSLTLQELAALLGSAALVVANSTGPLHLAAALGTPVVGLYPQHPAMSARRWGPYTVRKRVLVPEKPEDCDDCTRDHTPACACMASIGVDQVFRACRELLRAPERKALSHG